MNNEIQNVEVIYTCPECGHDLFEECLLSSPPQYKTYCPSCGWSNIEVVKLEQIRIPYGSSFTNSACTNCSNNPANGGSGICHCILGNNIVYC